MGQPPPHTHTYLSSAGLQLHTGSPAATTTAAAGRRPGLGQGGDADAAAAPGRVLRPLQVGGQVGGGQGRTVALLWGGTKWRDTAKEGEGGALVMT
jgi:hypothetical protein